MAGEAITAPTTASLSLSLSPYSFDGDEFSMVDSLKNGYL